MKLILAALICAPVVWCQNHAIMADRSGSMTPYYASGTAQELVERIHSAVSSSGSARVFAFSDSVTEVPSATALTGLPPGPYTYLDRAVQHAISARFATVWLITDNVQHQAGDPEAGNTDVFYRILRGESVRRVAIFPFKQPAGKAGLIVYALLIDPAAAGIFNGQIQSFSGSGSANRAEALAMKPLDQNTIEFRPSSDSASIPTFQEGQRIQHAVDLRLRSRFQHLRVLDSPVRAAAAEVKFAPSSLLAPEKREVSVKPDRVAELPESGESSEVYRIAIDLGRVRLKKDLFSLWHAAFGATQEEINLDIPVSVEVPQQNFRWKASVMSDFNAPSLDEAARTGRIYGVERLPQMLAEPTTKIDFKVPIKFRVQYPAYPALLIFGGLLILAALIGGGVWALARGLSGKSTAWEVSAQTEYGAALPATRAPGGEIEVNGHPAGVIKRNIFRPVNGAVLEEDSENFEVQDDSQARVRIDDRLVILHFRAPASDSGDGPEDEPIERS